MHDYPCSQADEAMYEADRANARLYAARQAAQQPVTLSARYAMLNDVHGVAVRTADRRVVFFATDGQSRELTNSDIPALVLLGDVGSVAESVLLDKLAGDAAAIACSRKSER